MTVDGSDQRDKALSGGLKMCRIGAPSFKSTSRRRRSTCSQRAISRRRSRSGKATSRRFLAVDRDSCDTNGLQQCPGLARGRLLICSVHYRSYVFAQETSGCWPTSRRLAALPANVGQRTDDEHPYLYRPPRRPGRCNQSFRTGRFSEAGLLNDLSSTGQA